MRIGLIIYGSLDIITGGYIYDSNLVDYLRSRQVVVKVFSQKRRSFVGSLLENFSTKIIDEIVDFAPDILLEDGMNFISLFLLNKKLKKIANFSIISIVHVLESSIQQKSLRSFFVNKIEKKYLESVNGFVFVSRATKLSVVAIVGINANSLVSYPGKDRLKSVDMKITTPDKLYEDKLMIIFIGNLLHNKGLHVLLEALAEIDSNLWQLSVIGNLELDTRYVKKILNMISSLKLMDNVRILGVLDVEKLKIELTSHHVLAVPSYYESYGIVYAEAMGEGLPVIASKFGGAQEIIKHSTNGFLVSPGDVLQVRNYLAQFIYNRELLKKMSDFSISSYRHMPSWEESMEKVYTFLCHNLYSIENAPKVGHEK